ncbi:MAG: hypothetical protein OXH52_07745 [Gammaproteobacteria bacterium]|nr:hypothetical protein [Gammaproteobacteria bacterium]
MRTLGEAPRNLSCLPYSQRLAHSMTVVARTSTDPKRTALELLTVGCEFDFELWVFETGTMDRRVVLMRLPQKLSAFVLFASGCWRLAAIGLYGVISHGVSQRTLVLCAAALLATWLPARRSRPRPSGEGVVAIGPVAVSPAAPMLLNARVCLGALFVRGERRTSVDFVFGIGGRKRGAPLPLTTKP